MSKHCYFFNLSWGSSKSLLTKGNVKLKEYRKHNILLFYPFPRQLKSHCKGMSCMWKWLTLKTIILPKSYAWKTSKPSNSLSSTSKRRNRIVMLTRQLHCTIVWQTLLKAQLHSLFRLWKPDSRPFKTASQYTACCCSVGHYIPKAVSNKEQNIQKSKTEKSSLIFIGLRGELIDRMIEQTHTVNG